jgi:hypothetical protein
MQRKFCFAVITATLLIPTWPAMACIVPAETKIEDVKYADAVVVGTISNYKIVRDMEFRKEMLSLPYLPPELREIYEDPDGSLLSDYARFDVSVEEALFGEVPKNISVTWDNSTFGETEGMAGGPFLIALRDPNSEMPPLRGPSATILPNKEPGSLTILQAPCAGPLLFLKDDPEAEQIRKLLKDQQGTIIETAQESESDVEVPQNDREGDQEEDNGRFIMLSTVLAVQGRQGY